jgi:hypothetical protein
MSPDYRLFRAVQAALDHFRDALALLAETVSDLQEG